MKSNSLVRVWEEKVSIPTYGVGKPEKNPIFLEKRVYQGSSGVVYPHPVIEKILDIKEDRSYHALFLENKYLKIMILPELGGRIQMAYDKVRERHFIYYNSVLKPALVGLTGPWISGGIEFNWPQHHRPTTFEPIDFTTEEHDDGSKTVWVNEVERMFRTKGMAGFRLYPDKAYLEINVKLFNRSPFPQTFLWWANPAVKVNDHYQSVFPPDVHAVFDHGKRDVSEFPIAKGTYYKVDYSHGVDISRYKNIPVPTSYMAVRSKYDFMGGYEHDTKAGLLHVADRHISPGKKQWTWGNGEFGYAWDRNLTDTDGPYVELMTGVFSDNQPDFSWIQPNEERTFTQYFMPYSELGVVKNATKEAMVSIEVANNKVILKHYTTSPHEKAKSILFCDGKEIWSEVFDISPEKPFTRSVEGMDRFQPEKLKSILQSAAGKILVEYQTEKETGREVPEPASPAKDPDEIASVEQLYLTGLHIEQYRHATYSAPDYYLEALRREPGDVRNNNAMGLWLLRRGRFVEAESHFRKSIQTLTERNANPYDSEPYFNLGNCLVMQDRFDEAYEAFYKAAWSSGWQDAAYLNLARIATRKGAFEDALTLIEKSLTRNWSSHTARHLKAVILRKLDKKDQALAWVNDSIAIDKFNYGCLYEEYVLCSQSNPQQAVTKLQSLWKLIRGYVHNYIEYTFDYVHAGLYEEARDFLRLSIDENSNVYPMVYYYLGYFALKTNDRPLALSYFRRASEANSDYCFPNRIEDVNVLQTAIDLNEKDAKAPYYLGNFWYANRQYPLAIRCWEKSLKADKTFPTVHRNLALAYHNKLSNEKKALQFLEQAFKLDSSDARVLMELDQLYKKLNKSHKDRLALLEKHKELTSYRDDLYLEKVTLYNQLGQFEKAKQLISVRKFHPWEGGEGKVVRQYVISYIELSKEALVEGKYDQAHQLLEEAETYPHNLGEGKLYGTLENDILYLKGCIYEAQQKYEPAVEFFKKASIGITEPSQAVYYNDQQPDKIFYQGMALKKISNNQQAEKIFQQLIRFGMEHLNDKIRTDYFAVSLPDLLVFDHDLDLRNKVHCHYLIGLGYLGLGNGNATEAEKHFDIVLQNDVNHFGAAVHKKMIHNVLLVD